MVVCVYHQLLLFQQLHYQLSLLCTLHLPQLSNDINSANQSLSHAVEDELIEFEAASTSLLTLPHVADERHQQANGHPSEHEAIKFAAALTSIPSRTSQNHHDINALLLACSIFISGCMTHDYWWSHSL